MKAHEQQWEQDAVESRSVVTHDGYRVAEVYPASAFGSYAEQREIARLISAAPDMARALLVSGYEDGGTWHTAICWEYGDGKRCSDDCESAVAALKKAGVLP